MMTQKEFSNRERQIVAALLEAKAVKDIARDLNLSVNTVKDYLKSIYRKAQVHSARELMRQMAVPAGPISLAPPPDTGLALLLRTAQMLGDCEGSPREVLDRLAGAVRRCTRARQVSFWRWTRTSGELGLAHEPTHQVVTAGTFLQRLHDRGWARLEPGEVASFEARQLAQFGLWGEVMGTACESPLRVQVMLAGDPIEGQLAPLDPAMLRLLAKLTQTPSPTPRVLRATA